MRPTSLAACIALAGCGSAAPPPPKEPAVPARDAPSEPEVTGEIDLSTAPAVTAPAACPSGQGVTAAVTKASLQDRRTVVEIDTGQRAGITRQWSVGGPAGCVIVRIEPTRIIAACAGTTPAQALAAPAVLCAPAPVTTNTCPSGTGVEARIVAFSVQGSATVLSVGAGTTRGVGPSWKLVRPGCTVQRVNERTTVAVCPNLTPEQVQGVSTALLCAP